MPTIQPTISACATIAAQKLKLAIEAVLPAASKDEDQPTLNGVCLEAHRDDIDALATDGTWVASYAVEAVDVDDGFRLLIPLHVVKRLLPFIGKSEGEVRITTSETLSRITLDGVGTLEIRHGDGIVFPDVSNIWPTGEGVKLDRVALGPKMLANVSKAFKKASGDGGIELTFEFRGERSPIVVSSDSVPEMTALVMPMGAPEEKEETPPKQAEMFAEASA